MHDFFLLNSIPSAVLFLFFFSDNMLSAAFFFAVSKIAYTVGGKFVMVNLKEDRCQCI